MNVHPSMRVAAGQEGLTHTADLERLSNTTHRAEKYFGHWRCSVYSAIFTRKNLERLGPMTKASWVVAGELPPGVRPRVGDRITNVVEARTGRQLFETLHIVFVQPFGTTTYYHLWVAEAV